MDADRKETPIWKPLSITFAVAILVASIGGWLTDVGPWYRALNKPSFQPPNWVFGPVWTMLYASIAIAAALAWQRANPEDRTSLIALFALNAALNVAWSGLFFAMKRPDLALLEIAVLWASTLLLVVVLRPISTTASLLLVPYLLWVSFAAYLNWAIARLNA